jgi:sulfate adenylyltransferase
MSKLVRPHGSPELKPLLLEGEARAEEMKRAAGLRKVPMTTRETSDLIMMAIGAFTPLDGFMGRDDWKGSCESYVLPSKGNLFWPIPITLSASDDVAAGIAPGEEVALWDTETEAIVGTMKVTEKYGIDKEYECKQVFRTADPAHPGVKKVMEQGPVNLAGPVKALSESYYPEMFAGIYQRPAEARKAFEERGWSTVAALQLRNPMHDGARLLEKAVDPLTHHSGPVVDRTRLLNALHQPALRQKTTHGIRNWNRFALLVVHVAKPSMTPP